jgi:hypothetical protein
MEANPLFGPAHTVGDSIRVDSHNGVTLSEAPVHPTHLRTPLGPLRYDEYCHPGWFLSPNFEELAEEKNVVFKSCAENGSLMFPSASCPNPQPLQVETAGGVALVMPGAKDGTPQLVNSQ